MDFTSVFLNLTALVAFIVVVTDALIRIFKTQKKLFKQITAWTLSVVVSLIGFWLKQGLFSELTLLASLATSIGVGLAANGLATVDKMKTILDFLLQLLPKKLQST
jgi:hypothetical protein